MRKSLTCIALSLLTVLIWRMPNQPQASGIAMPAGKLNSLSYAPYRAWQSPHSKAFPACSGIAADLRLIAGHADGIRTYSSVTGDCDLAALAGQSGLKLWLGIWLSANPADNAREMAAGIAEANAYPDTVTRVIVGNEVLLRRDLSVSDLTADIDYVRARVRQPVAYADVPDFWRKFPQVADHVSIVMIHFLPYWENHPLGVDAAIRHIATVTDQFKALFPAKTVSIGEAGWPSRGRWREAAAPSRVNEAIFLRRFVAAADQEHVDYNIIEAFDQPWKYEDEGVAGANWGIWNAHRLQKFALEGGVVEHPDWPWYALLGIVFSMILWGSVWFRACRLAVPAFMLGNGLALACAGTLPMLYDNWLILDALINLPLQAVFAFRIIARADAIAAGRALPAHVPAQASLAALRRGRLMFDYDTLWTLFLAGAAIFQILLVFDGRYRDAPMAVFIVPVLAALIRLWTRDWPLPVEWEDRLAANVLAAGALASTIVEGPANLAFLAWNIAAIVLALPVLAVQFRSRPGRGTPGV